jgi:hypothetical protein
MTSTRRPGQISQGGINNARKKEKGTKTGTRRNMSQQLPPCGGQQLVAYINSILQKMKEER